MWNKEGGKSCRRVGGKGGWKEDGRTEEGTMKNNMDEGGRREEGGGKRKKKVKYFSVQMGGGGGHTHRAGQAGQVGEGMGWLLK